MSHKGGQLLFKVRTGEKNGYVLNVVAAGLPEASAAIYKSKP